MAALTDPWIADISDGYPSLTGAVLKARGCVGAIGYAGCDNNDKNVSPARYRDWLTCGLMVGLVIENGNTDLAGGATVGRAQGVALKRGADILGYDLTRCVGYLSADWDVPASSYPAIAAALNAAAFEVPGLYGPGPLLEWLFTRDVIVCGWNSESTGFGTVSARAQMVQRWYPSTDLANPAHNLPADVNFIRSRPLHLAGEALPKPPVTVQEDDMYVIFDVDEKTLTPAMIAGQVNPGIWELSGRGLHWVADVETLTDEAALPAAFGGRCTVSWVDICRRLREQAGPGGQVFLPPGCELAADSGVWVTV